MLIVTKELADLVRQDWARLGRNRRSLGLIADLHGTSKETIALILNLELSEEDKRRERKGLPAVKPPRKGRKVIDYERMDELILEGVKSNREIAVALGVCAGTVQNRAAVLRNDPDCGHLVRQRNRTCARANYSLEEKTDAVRRYHEGEKQRDIAKDMGVTPTTLCKWVKQYIKGELK